MRAFTLDSFEARPAFHDDLAEPRFAENALLVRVHASSVNPVDAFIAAGGLKGMAEYEFPVILGRDFAGVVETVGSGVQRYSVGDEVFGFILHADPTVTRGAGPSSSQSRRTTRSLPSLVAWTSRSRAPLRSRGSPRWPLSTHWR